MDQSLNNTGYAILDAPSELIYYGKLTSKLKAKDNLWDRLTEITDKLETILQVYEIEQVILELPLYHQRTQAGLSLIRLETVIQMLMRQYQVPTQVMSARSDMAEAWPQQSGFYGRKEDIRELLIKNKKIEEITLDECDAIGVAIGGYNLLQPNHFVDWKKLTYQKLR